MNSNFLATITLILAFSSSVLGMETAALTTPSHSAAQIGNLAECRTLLANKADIQARDSDQNTALHLAAGAGHTDVCNLLLEGKALLTCYNAQRKTPLDTAAEKGYLDICKAFIKAGAPLGKYLRKWDKQNGTMRSPLSAAAINGHRAVWQLLIANGATLSPSVTGDQPLDKARESGRKELIGLAYVIPEESYFEQGESEGCYKRILTTLCCFKRLKLPNDIVLFILCLLESSRTTAPDIIQASLPYIRKKVRAQERVCLPLPVGKRAADFIYNYTLFAINQQSMINPLRLIEEFKGAIYQNINCILHIQNSALNSQQQDDITQITEAMHGYCEKIVDGYNQGILDESDVELFYKTAQAKTPRQKDAKYKALAALFLKTTFGQNVIDYLRALESSTELEPSEHTQRQAVISLAKMVTNYNYYDYCDCKEKRDCTHVQMVISLQNLIRENSAQ